MSWAEALAAPGLVEPAHWWVPEYTYTAGDEFADLAAEAGLPPDVHQRLCLDVICAEQPSGLPAVFEIDVNAPRRNLKTGLAKMCSLGWLWLVKVDRVLYTAHDWNPAVRDMFRDMKNLVEANAWLSRRVRRIYEGNGDESIVFMDGREMLFKTRTKSGGLGGGFDKVIEDEGLELQHAHVDAINPTVATKPHRQILGLSSSCKEHSVVWRERVEDGRAGGSETKAWIEWCMPPPAIACDRGNDCDHSKRTPGCGLDKPEMLRLSNPTLTTPRLTIEALREQRESLSPTGFGREFGGWHTHPAVKGDPAAFVVDRWSALVDDDPAHTPDKLVRFGVDCDLDGAWTTFGAAGRRADERMHLEFVSTVRGEEAAVSEASRIDEEHGPVTFAIDGGGPAKHLIDKLRDEGLDVEVLSLDDHIAAAKALVEGVNRDDSTEYVHGPQPELHDAVENARKRPLGERGFGLGRRKSAGDITAITSVMFAAWLVDDLDYDLGDSFG